MEKLTLSTIYGVMLRPVKESDKVGKPETVFERKLREYNESVKKEKIEYKNRLNSEFAKISIFNYKLRLDEDGNNWYIFWKDDDDEGTQFKALASYEESVEYLFGKIEEGKIVYGIYWRDYLKDNALTIYEIFFSKDVKGGEETE
jgi:hypothetical protein